MIEQDLSPVSELPGGATPSPPPEGFGQRLADFGQAVSASYRAQIYDGDLLARRNALSDAVGRRNWEVEKFTGATLDNPLEGGYDEEARQRLAPDERLFGDTVINVNTQARRPFLNDRLAVYQEKLGALQTQYPDRAFATRAEVPLLDDAKQLSTYWAQRAARGEPGLNATAGLAAGFLGGAGGFFSQPHNWLLLPVGGGEAPIASSLLGKVAIGAAKEAGVNAFQQSLAEPAIQAWRAERGETTGLGEAATDILHAGLFGAAFGAGIPAARAGYARFFGSRAAAEAAQRGAAAAVEADHAVLAEPPAGVNVDAPLRQALDHAQGLTDALPELGAERANLVRFYHGGEDAASGGARWATTDPNYARSFRSDGEAKSVWYVDIPKGDPTEIAARAWDEIDAQSGTGLVGTYNHIELPEHWARKLQMLDASGDAFEAAARLREHPNERAFLLSEGNPAERDLARLASLGDAAFNEARSGRASPDVALATAARVSNEGEQLAVMRDAMADRPQTPQEAAEAVSRAMERRATTQAIAALQGAPETLDAVPPPKVRRETEGAAQKQIAALETAAKKQIEAQASRAERASHGDAAAPGGRQSDLLLSALGRFLRGEENLSTRRTPNGVELRMDGSLLATAKAENQEAALSALGERLRTALREEGQSLPSNPEHMSLDQFTVAYKLADIIPEFEVFAHEVGDGGIVRDNGDGLFVDVRALYEKVQRQAQAGSKEAKPSRDLLDLAPAEDGRALAPADLLAEKTPQEELAAVLKNCPF